MTVFISGFPILKRTLAHLKTYRQGWQCLKTISRKELREDDDIGGTGRSLFGLLSQDPTELSHSSGGLKSKIRVLARLIPSGTSLLLTDSHPLAVSSHIVPLCMHTSGVALCVQVPSSYEGANQIGLGSPQWPHFNLIVSLKTLSANRIVTF